MQRTEYRDNGEEGQNELHSARVKVHE